MNGAFELEVNSFRNYKASQRFCLSLISGQIVPQNSPTVAEATYIGIGSWQGGNSKIVFRISKGIRIK